jgi:hypothetical protein
MSDKTNDCCKKKFKITKRVSYDICGDYNKVMDKVDKLKVKGFVIDTDGDSGGCYCVTMGKVISTRESKEIK